MIPQSPPEMHPLMLLMMALGCLPRAGFVATETLFQVITAGASEGATALNRHFSSMKSSRVGTAFTISNPSNSLVSPTVGS